jgi:hypothetical protein
MNKIALISLAVIVAALVSPVLAVGVGTIRITPALPIMLSSPATFSVDVQQGSSYDPHLLLVMTDACYDGLSGNVLVTWTGGSVSFAIADFESANTGSIPDDIPMFTGADYTVASCKSHLGTSEQIWWADKPFLAGPITTTPTSFTITFSSTSPKMLVYAVGMSSETGTEFDMKVPPTIPGFVIPELATLLLALGSFGALALYVVKRKKD